MSGAFSRFSTTGGNPLLTLFGIAAGFSLFHWVQHRGAGPTLVRAASSGGEHLRRTAASGLAQTVDDLDGAGPHVPFLAN